MRRLALIPVLLAAPAAAEDWQRLDGAQIAEALTDRVLIYENARQDFRASGRTLYTFGGRDSWGYWAVRDGRYCSQWPPSDLWACYDLERAGDRVRFVGDSADDISEAVYEQRGRMVRPSGVEACIDAAARDAHTVPMTPRTLADFSGSWRLDREITHVDGTRATFIGQADFTARGPGLDYKEVGVLTVPGQPPFEAHQSYRWGRGLAVAFPDSRHFHKVPPQGGPVSHWCAPDQYDGNYDFAGWPRWSVTWRVRGPRKDYTSVTQYQR